MSEPVFGNCEDCAAWVAHRQTKGRCVRRPPQVAPDRNEHGQTMWPITFHHDGCFDFIPRPETHHV